MALQINFKPFIRTYVLIDSVQDETEMKTRKTEITFSHKTDVDKHTVNSNEGDECVQRKVKTNEDRWPK